MNEQKDPQTDGSIDDRVESIEDAYQRFLSKARTGSTVFDTYIESVADLSFLLMSFKPKNQYVLTKMTKRVDYFLHEEIGMSYTAFLAIAHPTFFGYPENTPEHSVQPDAVEDAILLYLSGFTMADDETNTVDLAKLLRDSEIPGLSIEASVKSIFYDLLNVGVQQQNQHNYRRLLPAEKKLGSLFYDMSQGTITLDEFIDKSKKFEESLGDIAESDLLLQEAFSFIDELHDSFARTSLLQHPEQLQTYANHLLGITSKDYFFRPDANVQVKVTYEKIL